MRKYGKRNCTFAERFEANVIRSDGCWVWSGRTNKHGYHMTRIKARTVLVHRCAYELFVGPIPEGKQLDHLCRNRACVNPFHLEPVTSRENWMRGVAPSRENLTKAKCKYGHVLSGDNLILRTDNAPEGRKYRQCKTCRATKAAAWRQKMIKAGAPTDHKGRVRALRYDLMQSDR